MSFAPPEAHQQFQHILRLLNTNVAGKGKTMFARELDESWRADRSLAET
jgi:hypothetical protein